jgi:membrane fusion protein, macrolide-specific efflux system
VLIVDAVLNSAVSEGALVSTKLRRMIHNPLVVTPVVLIVAGGAFLGFRSTGGSSSASGATVERVVAATSGTIQETVSASGTIQPESTQDLNFDVSGTVTSVAVKAGSVVKKGQVLAAVDSASLQSDVDQAQATVDSDAAKVASDESSSASSAQLSADEAALTAARSQLVEAQASLADARLTSPIAGTVSVVNLTVGQQLGSSGGSGNSLAGSGSGGGSTGAASTSSGASGGDTSGGSGTSGASSSSSSTPEIEVVSTGTYVVDLSVDDTQIGQIKRGYQATVTPSGATTTATGTVTSVGTVATSSSGVSSFPVVVTVPGNPTGFYGGDTATVAIIYEQVPDAVQVPVAAVAETNGQSTVTVVAGGKHTTRAVTTGVRSNGEIQIVSGLKAGEQVVVEIPSFAGLARGRTGTGTGTGTGGFGTGGEGPPGGFGGSGGGGFTGGAGQ